MRPDSSPGGDPQPDHRPAAPAGRAPGAGLNRAAAAGPLLLPDRGGVNGQQVTRGEPGVRRGIAAGD